MKKLEIYKCRFFHMEGVTFGWVVNCPHWECKDHDINKTYNEFYEGAVLTAIKHIEWHQKVNDAQV